MTDEEERAAAYLESRQRRRAFEAARERGLRGSEAARRRVEQAWDALLPDGARKWEPKRLAEARKSARREDE